MELLCDEDVLDVCICSLHAEMRNLEQLLSSIGLFVYEISSLAEFNDILKVHGPETIKENLVTVKLKPNQETRVHKGNVKVISLSGKYAVNF